MAFGIKKVIERLLIFFIGVPLITGLVLFLPFRSHLALNVVVVVFTALGALEFSAMLEKKRLPLSKAEALTLGALMPGAAALAVSFNLGPGIEPFVFMAGASWALLSRVFSPGETLENFACRLAAGFAVLLYPGMFLYWLVKMSAWENAGGLILVFLLTSIAGDSTAWAAGMLFGQGNRGIVPASPNKSLAGFIGGIAGPVIVSSGAALLLPALFVPRFGPLFGLPPALPAGFLLGLFTGIAAMLGDLAESAIKRSAGFKDSGHIMPGRGGGAGFH
jgi:phosphatidate cytidylyltransferase